jgi:hypothetical protein
MKHMLKPQTTVKGLLAISLMGAFLLPLGFADDTKYRRVYDASAKRYYYVPEKSLKDKAKSAIKNPIVKQSAVGAAVGVAAGALSDKSSALKGAGIGALVGAGSGLIDTSSTLNNKPLLKTTLKGAAIGTGASAVMDKSKLKGAAAGAAAGAGVHLLKDYLNNSDR